MRHSIILFLFVLTTPIFAQKTQFGVGYGLSYYHRSLTNLNVAFLELNEITKPWYSDKLNVFPLGRGFSADLSTGNDDFQLLFNWSQAIFKGRAGGFDPLNQWNESLEFRSYFHRIGFGFEIVRNKFAYAVLLNTGRYTNKYITSNDVSSTIDNAKYTFKHFGVTLNFEYFINPHVGVNAFWYMNLANADGLFDFDPKYDDKYSNIGLNLTLYLKKNGNE